MEKSGDMKKAINSAMEKLEHLLELGGTKKDITLLVISGIALILSLTKAIPLPFDIAWVSIILCGVPIVLEAIIGLVTAFDIKADVLVSLALIASVCIGEVAFIMQLGALLEDLTVAKARAGIEKLVHLTPQTARIISGGSEKTVPAEQVKVGDILRVLPGESVSADGIIISGQTSVNQAVMTGESLPVDESVGDEVSSGTVNQFGTFEMRATKVGEDSSIQRMIRLVQSADAGKAKIVGIADRWATELQEKVYKTLDSLEIPYERVDTDEAITMEDCVLIDEKLKMKMVKTLFLCNRQQTLFYLFITVGDKPFRSKDFSTALGISRVSFAPAELMDKMLGTKIGAATIFSALLSSAEDVQIIFDRDVLKEEFYGCSDGTTTGYMKIKTDDIIHKVLRFAKRNHSVIEV